MIIGLIITIAVFGLPCFLLSRSPMEKYSPTTEANAINLFALILAIVIPTVLFVVSLAIWWLLGLNGLQYIVR